MGTRVLGMSWNCRTLRLGFWSYSKEIELWWEGRKRRKRMSCRGFWALLANFSVHLLDLSSSAVATRYLCKMIYTHPRNITNSHTRMRRSHVCVKLVKRPHQEPPTAELPRACIPTLRERISFEGNHPDGNSRAAKLMGAHAEDKALEESQIWQRQQ